jgi:prepilin-type N-terminal cleavage/methylation domain-containing protein
MFRCPFLARDTSVTYNSIMRKNTSGFTIVELLIVIVVIAILATISIVAYTGIQRRANNTKTVSAVTTYIKALNMYKVDNGQHPPVSSCLGSQYDSVGCDSSVYTVNGGGLNTTYLATYLGSSVPMPAPNRGVYLSGRQMGGAWYVWNNASYGGTNNGGIGVYHQGGTTCPSISGLTFGGGGTQYEDTSGMLCRYRID